MIKEREANSWKSVSYAKSISGAQTYTKFPIVLRTTEQSIPTWSVKGNTVQNGTPTPSNPVAVNGVGVRTENLFDELYPNIATNVLKVNITVPNGEYTLSTTAPLNNNGGANLFLLQGNDSPSTGGNGVWNEQSRTITITDGVLKIGYRSIQGVNPENYKTMLNEGQTAKPYEPYGYKIPISSGGVTTNIYLGSTQTVRQINKLVLTGQENWDELLENDTKYFQIVLGQAVIGGTDKSMCTHYVEKVINASTTDVGIYITLQNNFLRIRPENVASTSSTDFKAWLAAQYANGTPVIIWYVLATSETATVNVPLMKIGDYADTLSNATAIPTTSGLNTIDVNTTLKPSEMSLTFDGYKLCKRQRYSRTENLFDDTNIINVTGLGERYGVILPSGTYSIYNDTDNAVNYGTNNWTGRFQACAAHSTATINLNVGGGAVGGFFMALNSSSQGGCTIVEGSTPPDHYIPYYDWV